MRLSPELRLIVAPRETYAALLRARAPRASIAVALRRPLLVAAVIGVSVAMASTGRVGPALVASTTLTWSYVVLLQLGIAVALLAGLARHTIGLARAIDLFFAGHAPWSLFALLAAVWSPSPTGRDVWPLELLAIVPTLLTARIVRAFFAEVFGLEPRAAWRMMLLHQGTTWAVFLAINWIASAFTPRLLQIAGRM